MSKGAPVSTERFLDRQAAVPEETRRRVAEVKQRAIDMHLHLLQERNVRAAKINQVLMQTVERVNAQHRAMAARLRQEAISKVAHITVNRGLESLEELVRFLRRMNLSEEKMLEAVRDPTVSGTLFDRVRRASVSGLVQSVQQQLRQQYEFLNVAAHELRTPIMPILVNAELLYDKVGKESRELDTIMRNATRLMRLAENILDVTKIESGTIHYQKEPFDLNSLLKQSILDLEHTIRNTNIRIVFVPEKESLVIKGDQDRLGQVVANLLDNALKFTNEGRILVTSRANGAVAEVSVLDEGPGIDPQMYPVLFSKFASTSSKGTGLGLFISRSIIDAHGGAIWARSTRSPGNHGSVFTFVLPLDGAEASESALQPPPSSRGDTDTDSDTPQG